jgi:hypothetical protein
VRLIYRWAANGLAFYLALYLVDSLVAPRFYLEKGWIAIVLATLLGGINSLIRPFPRFKTRRNRALTVVLLTVIGNMLFIEIVILLGAPLIASNPGWVLLTAILLTLLAALLNWIIGFRPKPPSKVVTRRLGVVKDTDERERR